MSVSAPCGAKNLECGSTHAQNGSEAHFGREHFSMEHQFKLANPSTSWGNVEILNCFYVPSH